MMGWHNISKAANGHCSPGLMKCLFEEVVLMDYMVYFNFFGCVLIPLLVMLAIYLCIFMVARHQLKSIELKAVHGEKSGSTLQKEVQAAKSLAIIVGLFAVCWLPLHIINCFTLFCPNCQRPPNLIMYTAIILSHGNSVVNPFIYAYRIREFKQTFWRIIRRHILRRREGFENRGSVCTSTHNSITDSIRHKANGLSLDLFSEHSSGSCENSFHCTTDISPVGGSLVAASHAPLTVVISHCPQTGHCPLQVLRQAAISIDPHVHHLEKQQDGTGLEAMEDKQDLGSAQITVLLNKQNTKSFTEVTLMS